MRAEPGLDPTSSTTRRNYFISKPKCYHPLPVLHPGTLLGRGMCTFTVYRVVRLKKTALPKVTGEKGVRYDMLMCTVKLQKVVSPNRLPARHTISCSGRQSTFTEKRCSPPTMFSASDPLGLIFINGFIPPASKCGCVF